MNKRKTQHIEIGIVVSRFNRNVTQRLLDGCLKTLKSRGVSQKRIRVRWVPGAFEIPCAVSRMIHADRPRAVISLGAILKGETPQNVYIAQACAYGLTRIAVETRIPCIFGIIVPDTMKQALARTRGSLHRGVEAAQVALEVLHGSA